MSVSTTKLVISTSVVAAGSLLGGAAWYARGVLAVPAQTTLENVTEKGAYVDTFYYKLLLQQSPKLSASILVKSLYCSPSFLPEKILISLTGPSFPKEAEYDSLVVQTGTKIAHWTIESVLDTEILMRWPGGYTYLKANYLEDSSELEFWFGSNLSAKVSASPIAQAMIPFHIWYSRILCKNVIMTMANYITLQPK